MVFSVKRNSYIVYGHFYINVSSQSKTSTLYLGEEKFCGKNRRFRIRENMVIINNPE